MKQVEWVRSHVIRVLTDLRIRLTLPGPQQVTELDCITRLGGQPFTKPENLAAAVDVVMEHLGATPINPANPSDSKTLRAVNKHQPSRGRAAAGSEAKA